MTKHKTPLIIETDIGRDVDDLFAILYLIATDLYDIKAILITPGDRDQVAVARFMLKYCGLTDIPIGIPKRNWDRNRRSSGGMHYRLLNKYNASLVETPDGGGADIIKRLYTEDTAFFIIGPATNVGDFAFEASVSHEPDWKFKNSLFMQGGFCPYSKHNPPIKHNHFIDKQHCPTFNFNGDRNAVDIILDNFQDYRFVGKNVCHTIQYSAAYMPTNIDIIRTLQVGPQPNNARLLFVEASQMYFKKHDVKKFHDPLAAVCMTHPGIGKWLTSAKPERTKEGYTTLFSDNYTGSVLVDVDRDKFWGHIRNFT